MARMIFRKCFYIFLFNVFCLVSTVSAEEMLDWQECIKEAAKNHPDLIAAQEQIRESRAGKDITASGLYPQISANLNAGTGRTASGNTSATVKDGYNYGLSGTQLIFDGIKTINEVKAAKEDIKAFQENFKFTSVTVRFRLRSAFISLLKAQEMLKITEEIFQIRRGNYELIALRYQSGLEHKGALLTAEADLAEAKYDITQAKRELEVAQRNLIKEMGRLQMADLRVKGDFTVRDEAREKPDFVEIVKNNPSLLELEAQKRAAAFSLKSAYGNFAPTLTGSASANKNDSHWPPQGDQWNLGFTLSMPIFEGGLRTAQVSQARANLNQLKENERSSRDSLVAGLEQSWARLQDTVDNVDVQNKMLIADQERSRIAQAQYSIGFISFDNWTIIEDNLVQAKKDYLNAQSNALLAEASWIQAKGETLEYAL